jgi:hypothetical protein
MINDYYGPIPNVTIAYHVDGSGDKYWGKAAKGSTTSLPRWSISKMEYDGSNWIIKYPDGTDAPKFIWDNVESLSYKLLGT